ncbi:hypothetical protein FBZ96_105656 [Bradyrhizobium stylosanthis]|uniref:Uncharacterized protein n=1 Tax=Bradyrhizobium stylosanthis TaxID=1803665 RepID=A0A560DPC9_9BRAD|nr:hypothetical protein FBZ96_105656 [Bradyrhizobium stylosanthis]
MPKLKQYRRCSVKLLFKKYEYNAMAHKVAAYLNKFVLTSQNENQQYLFATLRATLVILLTKCGAPSPTVHFSKHR